MAARNDGIVKARGRYILPVDSDDIICSTYIEKAVDIIHKNPKIGIVYCEAEYFGDKNGKWDLPKYSLKEMLKENCIFVTALFRRSDWEKVGGYKDYVSNSTEDYDFWLALIENGAIVYQIPEILFKYRIRENSRSAKCKYDKGIIIKNHKVLYKENIELLEKRDLKQYIKNELKEENSLLYKLKLGLLYVGIKTKIIKKLKKF
mgnify:CR=1 FL=1